MAVPVAACGIIIGTVVQSGLANKFSGVIAVAGGSSLLLALLITVLGCMLLGMALPTVAAYLIAVVLFVPVMVKLGLPLLVCHMFCFYFGVWRRLLRRSAWHLLRQRELQGQIHIYKFFYHKIKFYLVDFGFL